MGMRRTSREERNKQLSTLDGTEGRYGRLRLRQSMPMYWTSKDKVEFECLDCGTGSEGEWEMQIHNVLYGRGCPMCQVLTTAQTELQSQFPQYRLVPMAPKLGPPAPASIRYEVRPLTLRLDEDFGWAIPSLAHSSVKRALAQHRLPGEEMINKYQRFVEVAEEFSKAFPNGSIRYAGESKEGSTSPGPFYSIDTGDRELRKSIKINAITAEGLLKHCGQETRDKKLKAVLESEASQCHAKILGYEHPESGGFQIRYLSRTGFMGCDTRWRAREKFWGQSGFRRGETLALVVLAELFPADDWLRNTRPSFLLKDNGYRLELDGYSPSLKLALEYQGNHHYKPRSQSNEDQEKYKKVIAHDKLKKLLCKEVEVRLVEVPEDKLNPDAFVSHVTSAVAELGITPTNPAPSLDAIRKRWSEICANPLAPFHALLQERLGVHRLIDPDLSVVCKTTVIRYVCGHCKEENEALANGFTSGEPRRYCPKCKGQEAGARKRSATLDLWESEGLPRSFLDVLRSNEGDGSATYIYICAQRHRTPIHSIEHARRHIISDTFQCPTCVSEQTRISASQVANLQRYRQNLEVELTTLGLKVVKELPYDEDGHMVSEVECGKGHRFTINRRKVALMARNVCLNDKEIVPSACPECCYPGVDQCDFWLLRSTVFHRLHVLGGMYPKVQYLGGFDPTSWHEELYSCGEVHADGTPHAPIRTSFRNLQRSAKRYPDSHLCTACGLQTGQVVGGKKTLGELVSLMKVIREDIDRRVRLPGNLSSPTVQLVSGKIFVGGEVSTTKTRLRFWCGVHGHEPVEATKDYYFNRAESRGCGFCPQCVEHAGEKKAPLPSGKAKGGALRSYKLRKAN